MKPREYVRPLTVILLGLMAASAALAQQLTYPPKPGDRDFIVDEAKLLSASEATKIKELCDKLLTDKKVPILVVTIASMSQYGASGWDIRVYAENLFNNWGIGFKDWNHGILLLVSNGDRRARIELGAGWEHRKDAVCQRIMDDLIIPSFKQGRFAEGIVAGVQGLDKMARELKLPTRPRPWWHYALVVGAIGLMIFTVVSLIRRRSSGWAWLFWGVVFALIGTLLYQMLRSGASGGWSGGSFGGGFSGGGGASGSW